MREFSAAPDGPPIFEGENDETGMIAIPGQAPGTFRATIYDAQSNPFQTAMFSVLNDGDSPPSLKVDTINVKGTIARGAAPLSAELSFGGRHGSTHVGTRSDASGVFSAVLPHGGPWRVEVDAGEGSSTFVDTSIEPDTHGVADVRLELPSNRIDGMVLDEQDKPVAGASVAYTAKAMLTARSAVDGTFSFRDVPVGSGQLSALASRNGHSRSSNSVTVDVGDGATLGPFELKLQRSKRVSGEVRSARGSVAGAMVSILSTDPSQPFYTRTTTNADGAFEMDAPDPLANAVFVASPPGFALRAFSAPLDGRDVVLNVPTTGGTLRVRLESHDAAARLGVFVEQDGKPLPLQDLANWVGTRATQAGGENAWDVPNLSAGHYRVCIVRMDAAGTHACAEGDLAVTGELELSPRLR